MKKEFTMADHIFAMIGRFSVFCAVVIGGCILAGLVIEESDRRNEPEDSDGRDDDEEGDYVGD